MRISIIVFGLSCAALTAVDAGFYIVTFVKPDKLSWASFGLPQINAAIFGLFFGLLVGAIWTFAIARRVKKEDASAHAIAGVAATFLSCYQLAVYIAKLTISNGGQPLWSW